MNERRPRIVVGLTGGIAAYKVVDVIRDFVRRGADVTVVPSDSALEFIGLATLEAISRNPVHTAIFNDVAEVRHVALGQSADAILVAPATANSIAALAEGRADSLLLTTVLASHAPVIVAPAMHTEMWENEATRANVATLRERGFHFVGPESGALTGNDSGVGRLANPAEIAGAVWDAAGERDLEGVRFLITAGGTREPIDPVRFIGNASTGHMGVALAAAARDRGADVTLIAAHLEVDPPAGVTVVTVSTAEEMRSTVFERFDGCDVFCSVAAVSDFRIANRSDDKIKRENGAPTLVLEPNPDILAEAVSRGGGKFIVGFAAETDVARFTEIASAKARRKGASVLVANLVGESRGFGNVSTNTVFLNSEGDILGEASGSKRDVAHRILSLVSRQK
jgi:phosphopantothenoylcysteine decarboxylase/phosphopantothenate--cysteine ligase